jgi:putative ABC transport system permease protein
MITSTFEELGTNVLYVQPVNPDAPAGAGLSPGYAIPNLTLDDVEALVDIPSVSSVVAANENFIELTTGGESTTSIIHGSTPDYLPVYGYNIGSGQFISDRNVASRDMVVVLGSGPAEDLFGSDEAVGQTVKMQGKRFTVIGVLAERGGGLMGFSFDDVVVVPITTYQTKLFTLHTPSGEDAIQQAGVLVANSEAMDQVTDDIETILRKRHRIDADEKDDFAILSQEQVLGIFNTILGGFTMFLLLIASISLLVGSIGIMNIMLVSVTERTREIGVRKAIGAKRRDILLQFLIEATVLSLVGGAVGITSGIVVSEGISWLVSSMDIGFSITAVVSPYIVILAVSVSVIIGLISGLYPAWRAARLNPIDALHYG